MPLIPSGYFDTRSTMETIDDHYLFYVNETDLRIYITLTSERSPITWSSPLFQQIKYLRLELPIVPSSLLNSLLDIVNFHQISDDDVQEDVIYLSNFVHLPTIHQIEFGSSFNKYRWKHAQFVLEACPNVFDLTMLTALLISSKFIDNPSLIPVFKKIYMIETILEDVYFPSSFAPKFVERFPSLIHIELQVATITFLLVAERSLAIWSNEYIVQLVEENLEEILPILLPPLCRISKTHWNTNIVTLTYNLLRNLMEINKQLCDKVLNTLRDDEKKLIIKEQDRINSWQQLEQISLEKQKR
ncbi:unnamed protein product [Rotaria sp. Silwood2]|nr:unnamed protein product [Rotaria sp. Silwood2]